MLWLVDGSGGESHLWIFSRSWFSEMVIRIDNQQAMSLDDERLT